MIYRQPQAADFIKQNSTTQLITRTFIARQVHGNSKIRTVGNTQYRVVDSETDWACSNGQESTWVQEGASSAQERLLFNENSNFIKRFKEIAKNRCQGKEIPEVLAEVNTMIDRINHVNNLSRNEIEDRLDDRLALFIKSEKRRLNIKEDAFITLDFETIAREKLLVCRHKALLASSVIGYLVQEGILPPGNVRQYRSVLIDNQKQLMGAHVWATYQNHADEKVWMCDPRWSYVGHDLTQAKSKYGNLAIEDMEKRLSRLNQNSIDQYKLKKAQVDCERTIQTLLNLTANQVQRDTAMSVDKVDNNLNKPVLSAFEKNKQFFEKRSCKQSVQSPLSTVPRVRWGQA